MSAPRTMAWLAATVLVAACGDAPETGAAGAPAAAGSPESATAPAAAAGEPPAASRQAWFGDLHVHSKWSFDAYAMGVRVGPEDAWKFARGEPIAHVSGRTIRIDRPLDFLALTEHAEYLGVSGSLDDPDNPHREVDLIRGLTSSVAAERTAALSTFAQSMTAGVPEPRLVTDAVVTPAWRRLVEHAERANDPGRFTAFVGFEWSSMPDGANLHRNVIFRGANVPDRPFSAFDSLAPEDLWAWMEATRAAHDDVIAISHNGDLSNGRMYPRVRSDGAPLDAAWADRRNANEPVAEAMQIKGQSETLPALSPNDEWAGFEVFNRPIGGLTGPEGTAPGGYIRDALKQGLRLQGELGTNPYRMGVVGSTDGHNAASPADERDYFGKLGIADGTDEQRFAGVIPTLPPDVVARWSAAGLAGIWAEANTRAALFDALRRRETFSTSGPRIRVRLFAGPALAALDLDQPGWVSAAYREATPMGGERHGDTTMDLVVEAARDPGSAAIERVQVVKGWVADGAMHEAVFDIACAGGAPVDPVSQRCTLPEGPDLATAECGALQAADGLVAPTVRWRDPTFDPAQPAFWYARVLERPTCRWTTLQSEASGGKWRIPDGVPRTIQERAITSAVWHRP